MGFNNFNILSIIEHHLSFIDINEDIVFQVFVYKQIQFFAQTGFKFI